MDKYEEFKEWWSRKGFTTNPFIEFEEEQAKREKEIEIKQTISYGMFDLNYYNLSIGNQKSVTTTYENLKRKELIK